MTCPSCAMYSSKKIHINHKSLEFGANVEYIVGNNKTFIDVLWLKFEGNPRNL